MSLSAVPRSLNYNKQGVARRDGTITAIDLGKLPAGTVVRVATESSSEPKLQLVVTSVVTPVLADGIELPNLVVKGEDLEDKMTGVVVLGPLNDESSRSHNMHGLDDVVCDRYLTIEQPFDVTVGKTPYAVQATGISLAPTPMEDLPKTS